MLSHRIDENLELVLPLPHQAEALTAVVRANLDRLSPWMPWATEDYSVESSREFIERNLKTLAEEGSFTMCVVQDGKIVGTMGFHKLDLNNKSAHIGYWLAREAEGKGLMTRCCRGLIEYLFDERNLNRIQINCNVENVRSRAIPERLGFQLEGIHRQVEFLGNRFGDWAVYAMLKEDWKNK
ncbi:MAG: GNAT family N-acetyltransferase [Acidobacteriota bacterium]|nr:GNAT family N-acetyltransferase [Acidobacteriota bacterium]